MKQPDGKMNTTINEILNNSVSCSCFHKHVLQALTAKVNELFGKESCEGDTAPPAWELDSDGPVAVSQRSDNDEKMPLSDINWRSISSKIANNWWIIAVSSLLPFVVFWRAQYNIKNRLHVWRRRVFVGNEKSNANSRRVTLPDLTLARHARRESLQASAEATHKFNSRSRKVSQCNISQFRSERKNSYERNEDSLGEVKRVHIIRRRH